MLTFICTSAALGGVCGWLTDIALVPRWEYGSVTAACVSTAVGSLSCVVFIIIWLFEPGEYMRNCMIAATGGSTGALAGSVLIYGVSHAMANVGLLVPAPFAATGALIFVPLTIYAHDNADIHVSL